MTSIDLSNNAFKKFPYLTLAVPTMNLVYIAGQRDDSGKRCLSEFPSDAYKHYSLRVLSLASNDIKRVMVTEFPTLLNYLNIEDNPNLMMEIPGDICTRFQNGTFAFLYDFTQSITGCAALGIK